jgi:hypothetical protein
MPRGSEEEAFATEKELIRNWGRLDLGTGCLHNRTDGGENPPKGCLKGRKLSKEHKRKMSEARKGKPNLAARGKKRSEETRRKMSKPRTKTWKLSEEDKKKLSAAAVIREAKKKAEGIQVGQKVGYRHSEEARKKISAGKKGKPGHKLTPEHIAAMAAGRKGKKRGPMPDSVRAALYSPESIAKATAARIGRKLSEQAKENMRIAALAREARKRGEI